MKNLKMVSLMLASSFALAGCVDEDFGNQGYYSSGSSHTGYTAGYRSEVSNGYNRDYQASPTTVRFISHHDQARNSRGYTSSGSTSIAASRFSARPSFTTHGYSSSGSSRPALRPAPGPSSVAASGGGYTSSGSSVVAPSQAPSVNSSAYRSTTTTVTKSVTKAPAEESGYSSSTSQEAGVVAAGQNNHSDTSQGYSTSGG